MSEPTGSSNSALDGTLSDALQFSPVSFLRTFWAISKSCSNNDDVIFNAIRYQNWTNLIPPIKYYGVFSLVWAAIVFKFGKLTAYGLPTPFQASIIFILIFNLLISVPLYYLCGGYKRSDGIVKGKLDGFFKIAQILIYTYANWIFYLCMIIIINNIMGSIPDESELYNMLEWVVIGIEFTWLFLVWFLVESAATLISKVFNISYARAYYAHLVSEVVLIMGSVTILLLFKRFA